MVVWYLRHYHRLHLFRFHSIRSGDKVRQRLGQLLYDHPNILLVIIY